MKKIALAALLSLPAIAAGAQTFSDALLFSENNYYGTARTIAIGNAVTALGGDLGTVGINPAGSAVASYSQFTISPGLAILGNNAGYSTSSQYDYSGWNRTDRTKFTVPNFASSMVFDTYQPNGLKSFTVAFAANSTNQFLNDFTGYGMNDDTSLLGSFAAGASPYSPADLLKRENYLNSTIPWNYLLAYRSGMISEAIGEDGKPVVDPDGFYTYLGTTEKMYDEDGKSVIRTMGQLDQLARVESYGSKTDFVMNMGFNISDRLFLGFNLGLPFASYNYSEVFRETAVDPGQFEVEYGDGVTTYFSHATYQYTQSSEYAGIYGKIGAIWLPAKGLRLGAAVQTPTLYTVDETWAVDGSTSFLDAVYFTSDSSPLNDYTYNLTTPWRFNAGVAYTFNGRGLISADLDMTDYKSMKFSTVDGFGANTFYLENDVNRNFAGMQYYGRFGVEYKIIPEIALRAGYTFKTSPEYYRFDKYGDRFSASDYMYWYDEFGSGRDWLEGREALPETVHSYSLGFGFSSEGSFFADVAFRLTSYPTAYYNPYSEYVEGYLPEVAFTRNLTDMVLTLGWRF